MKLCAVLCEILRGKQRGWLLTAHESWHFQGLTLLERTLLELNCFLEIVNLSPEMFSVTSKQLAHSVSICTAGFGKQSVNNYIELMEEKRTNG